MVTDYLKRNHSYLDESEIENATEEVVNRCFSITGIPTIEELPQYIDEVVIR